MAHCRALFVLLTLLFVSGMHCLFVRPQLRQSISKSKLASLRIKIHGTKNAFTTLQNNDIVLYELATPTYADQSKTLGVYSAVDSSVTPLCKVDGDSDNYCIAPDMKSLSATALNDRGQLLRVVSSSKVGNKFFVDEYIADDVHVPLMQDFGDTRRVLHARLNEQPLPARSQECATEDQLSLLLLQAEAVVADLKLRIAELKALENTRKDKNMLRRIEAPNAPQPAGPYSQAVGANGLVFVSGCIATSVGGSGLMSTDIEGQTRQCLANLKSVVEGAGSSVARICKTTIFLANIADTVTVSKIYADFLSQYGVTVLPARSTVGVAALPLGALVEIEAVAVQ